MRRRVWAGTSKPIEAGTGYTTMQPLGGRSWLYDPLRKLLWLQKSPPLPSKIAGWMLTLSQKEKNTLSSVCLFERHKCAQTHCWPVTFHLSQRNHRHNVAN